MPTTLGKVCVAGCLAVAVATGVGLGADDSSSETPPRKGDRVSLVATYGYIPYFKDELSYKQYLAYVKAPTPKSAAAIKAMYLKSLWCSPPDRRVDFVSAGDADPGPLRKLVNPAIVPAWVVKKPDAECPLWVPSIYVRPKGSKAYPVEAKFPVLAPIMDNSVVPAPGMEMYLENEDEIYVAKDMFDYEQLIKRVLATDAEGLKELVAKKRAAVVPTGTKVLIIERHTNQFIANGVHAAEVRFLDGPFKGQTAWVNESYTAQPTLGVVSSQAAAKMVNPPAKKKPRR